MQTRAFVHAMLVGLLSTVIIHTQVSASVIDVNVTAAATATDLGPQDGVFDAFTPLSFGSVNNNGFTSFRTAIEFDLSAVPTGAVVNAATLTTFANVDEGPREVALYGYAGDGSISLEDFSLGSLLANDGQSRRRAANGRVRCDGVFRYFGSWQRDICRIYPPGGSAEFRKLYGDELHGSSSESEAFN